LPVDTTVSILVVDDVKTVVRILTEFLRQIGFSNVDEAFGGDEALKMARSKNYGLIISDWYMDDGDGLDLCKALKRGGDVGTPQFIMVTVENKTPLIEKARAAGVDDYVTKPFSAETLRLKIEKVLARAGGD
jgi:two-component system, chemotaxis family, chemotaxis protein CheY